MKVSTSSNRNITVTIIRYDSMFNGEGADEYRVFVTSTQTGNSLFFRGPYRKLSTAKAQSKRLLNDKRYNYNG